MQPKWRSLVVDSGYCENNRAIWIKMSKSPHTSGEGGRLRAALHLEAGPIHCVRGLKSSLVIGQKDEINPNPFTSRGRVDLKV
jgi:hypothetical protein